MSLSSAAPCGGSRRSTTPSTKASAPILNGELNAELNDAGCSVGFTADFKAREGERDGEGIRWAGRLRTRMLTRVQCVCLDTGYVEIVKILIEHGANPNLCELDHVSVPARRCVQRKAARD